ncbi:hypothetical protein D3C72_1324700 [compost metagenome]
MIRVEADRLAETQPGFDAAVLAGGAVVVEQALNPLAADFPIGAVGEDRRVLQGDVHLIVEAVGDPALNLFAGGAAFVHRHMVRVVDVVIGAFGAQGRFEFGRGKRGVGHCGSPGNNPRNIWCLYRPYREQAHSYK